MPNRPARWSSWYRAVCAVALVLPACGIPWSNLQSGRGDAQTDTVVLSDGAADIAQDASTDGPDADVSDIVVPVDVPTDIVLPVDVPTDIVVPVDVPTDIVVPMDIVTPVDVPAHIDVPAGTDVVDVPALTVCEGFNAPCTGSPPCCAGLMCVAGVCSTVPACEISGESCRDYPCCTGLSCSFPAVCAPTACPGFGAACSPSSACCTGFVCNT
ncbi:MAG: hypothetical protein WCJ30_03065, partial [Deltaproteobacteria bacterium]